MILLTIGLETLNCKQVSKGLRVHRAGIWEAKLIKPREQLSWTDFYLLKFNYSLHDENVSTKYSSCLCLKCAIAHSKLWHKYNSILDHRDYICFQSNFLLKTSVWHPTLAMKKGGQKNSPESWLDWKITILFNFKIHFFFWIVFLCKPRGVSGENNFLPCTFWDNVSQKDSSKRKSKTCLY